MAASDAHWVNWTQRPAYVDDWNQVHHYYPTHYNARSYYDYCRWSKQMRQRMTWKGVKVLTYQQGQYGEAGYVAPDVTVGLIAPTVVYPDLRTGLDRPGYTGGPDIDHDNSLTIGGHSNMAPPVTPDATIPDHTIGMRITNLIEYVNLTDNMLGRTATMTVMVMSRNVTSVPPSDPTLAVGDVDFAYWDGSAFVAVTPTVSWEGALNISFNITLPAAAYDGDFQFWARFNAGVVTTEYEYSIVASIAAVDETALRPAIADTTLFNVYEQFNVTT